MSEDQRAQKSAVVDDVRGRFDEAEAILITEYRGLDVGQNFVVHYERQRPYTRFIKIRSSGERSTKASQRA